MKVGEIIVKPPREPGDRWIAIVAVPPHWPSDEAQDGSPALRGLGSDAALAIKDLWANIGRAYLGAEAEKAHEATTKVTFSKAKAWSLIIAYAGETCEHRDGIHSEDAIGKINEMLDALGAT